MPLFYDVIKLLKKTAIIGACRVLNLVVEN